MALAVTLFGPSTLVGLLSPVLFLIAVGLGAWAYARVHIAKAQDQAILTWRSNSDAHEKRAEIAEARLEEQRAAKHTALNELAIEKLKTDQTVVLTALADIAKLVGSQTETLERIATVIINGNGTADH